MGDNICEQPDDKGSDVCVGDSDEKGKESIKEEEFNYKKITEKISSLSKAKKIMLIICFLGLAFIIGWFTGVLYGFDYSQSLVKPCLCPGLLG